VRNPVHDALILLLTRLLPGDPEAQELVVELEALAARRRPGSRDRIRELASQGRTVTEISRELDLSNTWIMSIARDEQITFENGNVRRVAERTRHRDEFDKRVKELFDAHVSDADMAEQLGTLISAIQKSRHRQALWRPITTTKNDLLRTYQAEGLTYAEAALRLREPVSHTRARAQRLHIRLKDGRHRQS
jgi:hypothetical protein